MSAIDRIKARLAGLLRLGTARGVSGSSQVAVRATAEPDSIPWIQHAGIRARPTSGEAVVGAIGASSDSLVALVVGGRTFPVSLGPGEVVVYDEHGHRVLLTAAGISIGSSAGSPVVRVGDAVAAAAGMAAWITAVTTAVNAGGPATPPVVAPLDFGTASEGSSEVSAS